MPLFKKKEIFQVKSVPVDPDEMPAPSTSQEFMRRGMAYYARKEYSKAEIDLKQAISMDAMNVDAFYSLGMVLKAQGQKNEAVNAFGKVIEFLDKAGAGTPEKGSNPGKDILRRLALGHVNELTTGDWNLEKEIWQHTS